MLIGGLGGAPDQTVRIGTHIQATYNALVGPLGFKTEHVTVLTERALLDEPFVVGESTADNIRTHFASLANIVSTEDELYIVLFGHGSSDGQHTALNIPRRDLTDRDYADLANSLSVSRQVWFCTMSASAPFVRALSSPGRIVVTATRTATQRNQTVFPQYFAEALVTPSADLDQDGSLSVDEVFQYTAEKTAFHYSSKGQLATEHSLLEDTGDGEGIRVEDLNSGTDGHLADITYMRRADSEFMIAADDPLIGARRVLESQIASLKAEKETMDTDAYYAELEQLFVALARLNQQIESTIQ